MSEQISIVHLGHRVEVESDDSLIVAERVRLFIDGHLADERNVMWDARLHGELPGDGGEAIPVTVEVSYGTFGGVKKCILIEDGVEYTMRDTGRKPHERRPEPTPPKPDKESELLRAMKENDGRISPIKAATETSLTVKEADEILSELASDGHLLAEPSGGTMVYVLPKNEPEER